MTVPLQVSKGLRAALEKSGQVRLAVLFGSRATGTARPSSDFDIGILPRDPELPLSAELALASELSGVAGAEVDLVRLDGDEPELGREAAHHGVCLFEEAPGVFTAYRARALDVARLRRNRGPAPAALSETFGERMTNVVLVARKLATLEEHLRRLRERRPADVAAFRADALLQDAVALGVLVVVQEAIDIALHIASDAGWEHAASYRDAPAPPTRVRERRGGASARLVASRARGWAAVAHLRRAGQPGGAAPVSRPQSRVSRRSPLAWRRR